MARNTKITFLRFISTISLYSNSFSYSFKSLRLFSTISFNYKPYELEISWKFPQITSYNEIITKDDKNNLKLYKTSYNNIKIRNIKTNKNYSIEINGFDQNGNEIKDSKYITQYQTEKEEIKPELTELSRLDIKVGKIIDIKVHPEADSLYVEKVDVGESEPRTIISGLVKYCKIEELQNKTVIVLCNLKPRTLKGITSHGMLLCASNSDHSQVDPLQPPINSKIGEFVRFSGHLYEPVEPGNRVTKAFERVVDDLVTDDNGIATYQQKVQFMTTNGPCFSRILNGKIS